LDDTSKVGCNVAQEQKCGQQAQYGSTVAQVVACPGKTQCTCNGSTVCFNTTGSCTASDGLCALVKSTGNSSSSNSSNTQTGSSSVSGCIGEGGTVANGSSPCCSGLVQANCVANGSFSYCICTNPNNVPAPSPTETCTVRNCSGTTCASTTTTVSSNQACPPSSCANDNDCKNSTTSSSTTTINSGSNNSSTAYCNVSTQNLGCGEAGCAKTEMAQITTKVDCTKVTTCTQNINCGAVFKAQCTSGKTQCNSSTNLQTCVNGMWTIGEYCQYGCSNSACNKQASQVVAQTQNQTSTQQSTTQNPVTATTTLKANGQSCTSNTECQSGRCMTYNELASQGPQSPLSPGRVCLSPQDETSLAKLTSTETKAAVGVTAVALAVGAPMAIQGLSGAATLGTIIMSQLPTWVAPATLLAGTAPAVYSLTKCSINPDNCTDTDKLNMFLTGWGIQQIYETGASAGLTQKSVAPAAAGAVEETGVNTAADQILSDDLASANITAPESVSAQNIVEKTSVKIGSDGQLLIPDEVSTPNVDLVSLQQGAAGLNEPEAIPNSGWTENSILQAKNLNATGVENEAIPKNDWVDNAILQYKKSLLVAQNPISISEGITEEATIPVTQTAGEALSEAPAAGEAVAPVAQESEPIPADLTQVTTMPDGEPFVSAEEAYQAESSPALARRITDIENQVSNLDAEKVAQIIYDAKYTDGLTGLVNRTGFTEGLDLEIADATKNSSDLTIITMDLNKFKSINDEFGHLTGDDALVTVANLLKDNTRSTDLVVRVSGDEFALILPQTNEEQAQIVLQKIQSALDAQKAAADADSYIQKINIDAGIKQWSQDDNIDDYLKDLDRTMYDQKRGISNENQPVQTQVTENVSNNNQVGQTTSKSLAQRVTDGIKGTFQNITLNFSNSLNFSEAEDNTWNILTGSTPDNSISTQEVDQVAADTNKPSNNLLSWFNDKIINPIQDKILSPPVEGTLTDPGNLKNQDLVNAWRRPVENNMDPKMNYPIQYLETKANRLEGVAFDPSGVKMLGKQTYAGRQILELNLPTGDDILMYRSTGTNTHQLKQEGDWIPIAGFAKNDWFIKTRDVINLVKNEGSTYLTNLSNYLSANEGMYFSDFK